MAETELEPASGKIFSVFEVENLTTTTPKKLLDVIKTEQKKEKKEKSSCLLMHENGIWIGPEKKISTKRIRINNC